VRGAHQPHQGAHHRQLGGGLGQGRDQIGLEQDALLAARDRRHAAQELDGLLDSGVDVAVADPDNTDNWLDLVGQGRWQHGEERGESRGRQKLPAGAERREFLIHTSEYERMRRGVHHSST
jgi:hypothetical protein